MAKMTLHNVGEINNDRITISLDTLRQKIGVNKKIIDSILILNDAVYSGGIFTTNCGGTDKIIENLKSCSNARRYINISNEIDCALQEGLNQLVLYFTGSLSCSSIDITVNHISKKIMHDNNAYINFGGKNVSGKINLSTGNLQLKTPHLVYNGYQTGKTCIEVDDPFEDGKCFATHCGKGWKPAAQQHLLTSQIDAQQDVFTYIDADGNNHEFIEKYYYKINDDKVYVDKENVKVDEQGRLTFTLTNESEPLQNQNNVLSDNGKAAAGNQYEVFVERKSTSGLRLETDLTKFVGGQYLESRAQEQVELEENVDAYKRQLEQYVVVNKSDGATVADGRLQEYFIGQALESEKFEQFRSVFNGTDKLLFTDNEAIQYNSLLLQQTSDVFVSDAGKTVPNSEYDGTKNYSDTKLTEKAFNAGQYDEKLVNMKRLVSDLRKDLATLTKKSNFAASANSLNFQYDRYMDFLQERNYSQTHDCCLDTTGVGRKGYSGENANLKNNITSIMQAEGKDTDSCNLLEIDYHHLKNGYCDLQAELERIADDLVMYNLEENDLDPNLYVEKNRQNILEKRLRIFQNEFANRVENLQQNITKFEQKINDFLEKEQRQLVNRQLELLLQCSEQNKADIFKYFKQYINFHQQLESLYRQLPVNYISNNDIYIGFNKFGQFVATFDNYDNQTAVVYEDDKIVSVTDSDNKQMTFEYNDEGLLCKIVDDREKVSLFHYVNGFISEIVSGENEVTLFTYENDRLKTVTDCNNRKFELTYNQSGKIVSVDQSTNILAVKDNEIITTETYYTKNIATITYTSSMSTSVIDSNGLVTNYIFDQLGEPVTVFEGTYDDPGDVTKSVSVEYLDAKKSYSVRENILTTNLLDGATTGSDTLSSSPTGKLVFTLDGQHLPENVTDFVFSCWVKADSAYISDSRKNGIYFDTTDSIDPSELDENQKNRKFQLAAVVTYDDESTDEYSASFDWINTDWQFLALPVEIKNTGVEGGTLPINFPTRLGEHSIPVSSVQLILDYSYNVGTIQHDCLSFREGIWNYSTFDSSGKKLTDEDSATGSITKYYYNENDRVVKTVLSDSQMNKFITTFEYNKQGKLVRKTDSAGIVEETVYDENGRKLKSFVYNIDDPSTKLYSESKIDDKGVTTAEIDESGRFDAVTYTYDHNGENIVQSDAKGNKTSFGYKQANLVSISGSTDGEESTNTMHYTAELLTKMSDGNTECKYCYDSWNRNTKIEIAQNVYCTTEYIDDLTSKTTFANQVSTEQQVDMHGNVTRQTTVFNADDQQTVQNTYNAMEQLQQTTIDRTGKSSYNTTYKYNSNGNVVRETRTGDFALTKQHSYESDGVLSSTSYTVGETSEQLVYNFDTDRAPDKHQYTLQMPYGETQKLVSDGIGRTKNISLGEYLEKDLYYAKYGDHATSRVNSVWFGVNGLRQDNLRYSYDKVGNIITVKENGVAVARYVYDGLNRLIRENNLTFGEIAYEYDRAGNIVCKKINGKKYNYVYPQSGWKDQLAEYSSDSVTQSFAYDAIGNPTCYRGKEMTWLHRQLTSYDGITYTYDANGQRTGKTRNGITYKYIYDGNSLVAEQHTNGSQTEWLYYLYGAEGVAGFRYNGKTYLYRKNLQGDVTHIYTRTEKDGVEFLTRVAHYDYDAYGNCKVLADVDGIATLNPFRYRSYYYDSETALYYLQSRYYDPELGRFINADDISYLDPETIHGLNLYAYCLNNPVMYVDPSGNFVSAIFGGLSALISGLILGQSAEQIAYNVAVAALTGFLVDVAVASVGAAVPIIIAAIGVINFAADAGSQMLFEDKKINEVDWVRAGVVGGIAMATSLIGVGIGKAIRIKGENVMSEVFNMLKDPASWGAGYVYSFGLGMAVNIFIGSGAISTRGNSAQSHKTDENLNCYSY